MTNSRQVLRRVCQDAAMEKIPQKANVGDNVVILDRRERRQMARTAGKQKAREQRKDSK